MKRTIFIACGIMAFGIMASVLAQSLTPKQVIQQIRQAYDKVQSLQATVEIQAGNEKTTANILFLRPRQFSVRVTQNGKPAYSFTSDGKTFTTYMEANKSYQQQPVPEGNEPIIGGHLSSAGFASMALEPQFGEMLGQFMSSRFQKARSLGNAKVGTVVCRVIELNGNKETMKLYLGSKDGLVYRMVYRTTDGNTYEETVTSLRLNPPLQKTAFAFKPPAGSQKAEAPQPRETEDKLVKKGQDAPDFTLTDLEEGSVSLSSLRGKVVFIDFWATWCPPCVRSLPHTQALSQHEKAKSGDLVVLAINAREDAQKVKQFMQEKNYTFRVLLDKEGKVLDDFGVTGIPTFVVIDREGKVTYVQTGFWEGGEKPIEQAIEQALAK